LIEHDYAAIGPLDGLGYVHWLLAWQRKSKRDFSLRGPAPKNRAKEKAGPLRSK
jgi:hypothetical protein